MNKNLLPILTALFVFFGCATYVNVKIQKPASISLGDVKNVAVMDIEDDEFIGSYLFTEVGDAPLRERLDEIIEGKKKPKVLDLKNAYPGKTISDKLVTKLLQNGHYSIADRNKLDKVLEEQKSSHNGIINEEDAPEI